MRRVPVKRGSPYATRLLALALGTAAVGALAIGALAIGRLAIGGLVVRKARFGSVDIDDLTVGRLHVTEHPPDASS